MSRAAPVHRPPDPDVLELVKALARQAARHDHARETAARRAEPEPDAPWLPRKRT